LKGKELFPHLPKRATQIKSRRKYQKRCLDVS